MAEAVDTLRQAGFNEAQIDDWRTRQADTMRGQGYNDAEIGSYLADEPAQKIVPPSFLQRVRKSIDPLTILSAATKGFVDTMSAPTVADEEIEKQLSRLGIGDNHPLLGGNAGPIYQAVAETAFAPVDTIARALRLPGGIISALAAGAGKGVEEFTGSRTEGERARSDLDLMGQMGMVAAGSHAQPFERPVFDRTTGTVRSEPVGPLPGHQDFRDAAASVTNGQDPGHVEARLRVLWEQHGIHPQEVITDAAKDPVLAQALLSSGFDVYHGTPHDFEAFDLSKIGTGEGAQVFGFGLYFAERYGVAKSYQENVKGAGGATDFQGRLREALGYGGNMYKVRLLAGKEDFLDRDLAVRDQTPEIREKLTKVIEQLPDGPLRTLGRNLLEPSSGAEMGQAFDTLSRQVGPKQWSEMLRDAGIPGLKYFDASSRGDVAAPTRNFVVFDDKIVRIANKNDAAVVPGSPRSGELHSVVARTGDPKLDRFLEDPRLRDAIDNPRIVSGGKVPLGAGASADLDNTAVHFDEAVPHEVTTKNGVTFDPRVPVVIHELTERARMEELIQQGMAPDKAYLRAHTEVAERLEDQWYKGHGIDPVEVADMWKKWLAKTETEDFAAATQGLYPKPYELTDAGKQHNPDTVKLAKEAGYLDTNVTNRAVPTNKNILAERIATAKADIVSKQSEMAQAMKDGDVKTRDQRMGEIEALKKDLTDLEAKTLEKNAAEIAAEERAANAPKPGSVEEARDHILSKIDVGDRGPGGRFPTLDNVIAATIDKLFPVKRAIEDLDRATALTIDNSYKLMRLYAGWTGKATHFIQFGTRDFHTYEVNGKSLEQVLAPVKDDMRGFIAFVAGARDAELGLRGLETTFDLAQVQKYGKATAGKYRGVFEELVDYQNRVSAYLRDSGVISEKMYVQMIEQNLLFVPFHRVLPEPELVARQGGGSLIAKNPIKRILGSKKKIIDPIESIVKNTYLLIMNAEKNAATSKLVDNLKLLEGDSGIVEARPVEQAPVDRSELPPELATLPDELADNLLQQSRLDKDGEISRFVDGRRETYAVDRELSSAVKGLDAISIGAVERMMAGFTGTLRAGAVLDLAFAARHLVRDAVLSFVTYNHGVFTPLNMMEGAAKMLFGRWSKDYQDWLFGGGANVTLVSLDRNYMREDLAAITGQTGLFTRSWNTVVDPAATWMMRGKAVLGMPFEAIGKMIHPLQVVTDMALSASHLGAFAKRSRQLERQGLPLDPRLPDDFQSGVQQIKPGVSAQDAHDVMAAARAEPDPALKARILEAAWTSRDTGVDMQRIGSKMRGVNMISAFANAKIQDTTRLAEAFKTAPAATALKVAIGIMGPSVLLWWANRDDDRVQTLDREERDRNWIIATDKWEQARMGDSLDRQPSEIRYIDGVAHVNNGTLFRLPKPFAGGVVFGSGIERVLDAYYADHPGAFDKFFSSISDQIVGDLTPNAIAPVVDQFANRTTFPSSRTMIPAHLEKLLPEYQYFPSTTETAKALAQVFSSVPGIDRMRMDPSMYGGGMARAVTNPILMENYVSQWSGGLGRQVLGLTDYALRKAGVVPDSPKPLATLADWPFVKSFVIRHPSASVEPIQSFFEGFDASRRLYDTWLAKARQGDEEAMDRVQRAGGQSMFLQLTGVHRAVLEHGKFIQDVSMPNYPASPEEKRQLIDGAYYRMLLTAQFGRELQRQIQESAQ